MLTPADEALLRQLADGRFHSGQKLARDLNISRTAIWKQVRRLRQKELEIHAVRGRGYRLGQPLERLDQAAIQQALEIQSGNPTPVLEIHTCLDSTNTYLMQNAPDLANAHTCLAEVQTAGKGRLGRRWVSPFGCNIYLSMVWWFRNGTAAAGLSLAVGVAVVRALQQSGFPELQLKWPNDILWQGRKLGGILIEGISEHQGASVVVIGLGINLWLPARAAAVIDQPWVDGCTILGCLPRRNLTIARIISRMLALLVQYEHQGLAPWLSSWRRMNCVLGRQVQVVQNGQSYIAMAVDVNEEGMLLLEDQAGRRRVLVAGEVKLRVEGQG